MINHVLLGEKLIKANNKIIERCLTILYNNFMMRKKIFIMVMSVFPGLCLPEA